MAIKRKFRKLINNPGLFFKDLYVNRLSFIKAKLALPYTTKNNYKIVLIVYPEDTLTDLQRTIESVLQQSLCKKNIMLTVINCNESETISSFIISKSISQIIILEKELPQVLNNVIKSNVSDWITFITAGNFFDKQFLQCVDKAALNSKDNMLFVTRPMSYISYKHIKKDIHPLKFRFNIKNNLKRICDINKEIQPSIEGVIFKTGKIKNIEFNTSLKRAFLFEDFIIKYFCRYKNIDYIYFMKEAKFFYVKTTLDRIDYDNKDEFINVLNVLLSKVKELNKKKEDAKIDLFLQNTILYFLSGYIHKNLNNSFYSNSIYSTLDQKIITEKIKSIFNFINKKTIQNFSINKIKICHRVGFIEFFKNLNMDFSDFYIEKYDSKKEEILISYYTYSPIAPEFYLDGKDTYERVLKRVSYSLFGNVIAYQYRCWIPCSKLSKTLKVSVSNKKVRLFYNKKRYNNIINISEVINLYEKNEVQKCWLITDRVDQADDNGEHLYRYLYKNHPEQKCYYALKKESHDWNRLKKDGFNLIEYGSPKFEEILQTADKIISSHSHVTNYFGRDSLKRDFVFLQHGVIHNNHSDFFNSRSTLACFITTTADEYNAIAGNDSSYHLTSKEVILTGLPRHDSLIANNEKDNKIILIMPTWRRSLSSLGNIDGLAFMRTTYAQRWHDLLNSSKLYDLANKYGYKVIFAPHAEVKKYFKIFTVPDYIDIWTSDKYSIQILFQKSSFMITDYSSVAFEMAILDKLTIYYQFDLEDFYKEHYKRDYFDYSKHGFGPTVNTLDGVLKYIEKIIIKKPEVMNFYLNRISKTFPYRDGRNCERVYQAIRNINKKEDVVVSSNIICEKINQAALANNWHLVRVRADGALKKGCYDDIHTFISKMLFIAYCKRNDWIAVQRILEEKKLDAKNYINEFPLLIAQSKWELAEKEWNKLEKKDIDDCSTLYFLYVLARLGKSNEIKNITFFKENMDLLAIKNIFLELSKKNFISVVSRIKNLNENIYLNEGLHWKWQSISMELLMAEIYLNLNDLENAYDVLSTYNPPSAFDVHFKLLKAHLYYKKNKIAQAHTLINDVITREGIDFLSQNDLDLFLSILESRKNYKEIYDICNNLDLNVNKDILKYKVRALYFLSKWKELVDTFDDFEFLTEELIYYFAESYFRLGNEEMAISLLNQKEHLEYNDLVLLYNSYILVNEYSKAQSILRKIIISCPDLGGSSLFFQCNALVLKLIGLEK